MENYFQAKKILFDSLPSTSWAITNNDDASGSKIVQGTKASVLTYSVNGASDISAKNVSLSMSGTSFVLHHHAEKIELHSHLVGRFNIYNILAACSAGIALEFRHNPSIPALLLFLRCPGASNGFSRPADGRLLSITHTRRTH